MLGLRFLSIIALGLVLSALAALAPLQAQDRALPYWASLRYDTVNMRVGPSKEYPVSWIYLRQGLPVKVVRVREGWRLVEDPEGTQGWISADQLVPERGALVVGNGMAEIRADASATAALRWRAEPGVVARLLRCRAGWCEVDLANPKQREDGKTLKGWVSAARLWGTQALPGDE